MISYSEDQARAFVPDAGTLQRGQALAQPGKWANLGRTATAAWGECAGSGSKPYLTGIDLTEPAFRCSCPSRVFPCKHGAALLLLLARQPALFLGPTPPSWLEEWLTKRQQTQEKKAEKPAPKVRKPATPTPDAKAPADSAAGLEQESSLATAPGGLAVDPKRLARMAQGAEDLETWLLDLMRHGLASLDQQPARFWENQAARLVDNQLPGLAAIVRELSTVRHAYPDWPARLLARLGELYLLVRAFRNQASLEAEARAEVLQQVGISLKKDDLLTTTLPLTDTWLVLGQFRWEEDRLTARRTWLRGRHSGRLALVLEFAFGSQPFATPLIAQGSYQGELAFYPGLLPLRATPLNLTFEGTASPAALGPSQSIGQLLEAYAVALARQPWLREWPATLGEVQLAQLPDGHWQLHHAPESHTLPLRFLNEEVPYELLARSGGAPLTLFGEWDGHAFRVLSNWTAGILDAAAAPPSPPAVAAPGGQRPTSPNAASEPEPAPEVAAAVVLEHAPPVTWPQLVRAALLGTRQSREVIPPFPAPADSPTRQLLLSAGTMALIRKAGYCPAPATTPLPAPAPPEQLPATGPRGTDSLRQLLVHSLQLDLLPAYLVRLAERGRRVPHALLVPLLRHATRSAETRAVLGPVLGRRGRWLAAQHPAWNQLLTRLTDTGSEPADPAVWETGTLPERLGWLRRHFGPEPAAARALLLAALPTEPAKTQKALLEILADHLHPEAEPALELLLKARGQEVRRLAAELLVQLPGAALPERLWQRARPLLSTSRKLLGLGKVVLDVTLPDAWDKSWLLDGIEEKNARFLSPPGAYAKVTFGPATGRLVNLLAWLPPARWTAHLGLEPATLLAAALASEWAAPLLSAWARSTVLHRDADFAAAFLDLWFAQRPALEKAHLHRSLNPAELVALLPADLRQHRLLRPVLEQVRHQTADWPRELALVPAPWPRVLSAAVLAAITEVLANTASAAPLTVFSSRARELAWLLPQTVVPHLAPADFSWATAQIEAIPQVHDQLLLPLHNAVSTLRFQAELAASLDE